MGSGANAAQDKPDSDATHGIPAGYLHFTDDRISQDVQGSFPIWDQDIFKIGRDPRSNAFAIQTDPDNLVSRNHCEFYVVVYEPSVNHVYVRDRKSFNGTFVNGKLIGAGPGISSGHLLEDGDIIEIRPHWNFVFRETRKPLRHDLTSLQLEECELFADKYSLSQRCLGQGAEAVVFLATDCATKKQLVCKLVNLDKIHGQNAREELRRKFQEADVLRQLQHPNILPYVDAISSPHSLYTFTELASGGDLMSFIYRHDVVSEFDTRIIVRQIIRGLRYLHAKGIIHRDLKPENILLAYSPKMAYHRIMLSDFGTCAVPRRSRMVTNVGTATYQAPYVRGMNFSTMVLTFYESREFQTKGQAQTVAVDIWSLGMVTLLLLTTGTDSDFSDLKQMNQDGLGECIREGFAMMKRSPSSNGKKFVWGCLQLSPSKRISAIEAECHDWLCSPEKHLEFFRQLDCRIMAEWSVQNQLKPMPWELPSLMSPRPTPTAEPEPAEADDVDTVRLPVSHEPPPQEEEAPEISGYFQTLDTSPCSSGRMSGAAFASLAEEFLKPASPRIVDSANSKKVAVTYGKQARRTLSKLRSQSSGKAQPSAKRKKASVRVPDALLLPLPGLDRHLQPMSSNNHREKVLERLKTTNSKFLVDTVPHLPKGHEVLFGVTPRVKGAEPGLCD